MSSRWALFPSPDPPRNHSPAWRSGAATTARSLWKSTDASKHRGYNPGMPFLSDEKAQRLRYLWWATTQSVASDASCPSCGSASSRRLRRKYLVTSLFECPQCALRYRVPRETPQTAHKLYVEDESYKGRFAYGTPSQEELNALLQSNFSGSRNQYGRFIPVIQALGLPRGARVLDFGSAWGYGSFQIRQAGYQVFSYEIGKARAQFAREHLGCTTVDDLRELDATIDCFFSAHVIEHLPDPNHMFAEAVRLLVPGGHFVCFCPNGSPTRESVDPGYHRMWGQLHPLMITPGFMRWACQRHGLELVKIEGEIEAAKSDLLLVARKPAL